MSGVSDVRKKSDDSLSHDKNSSSLQSDRAVVCSPVESYFYVLYNALR